MSFLLSFAWRCQRKARKSKAGVFASPIEKNRKEWRSGFWEEMFKTKRKATVSRLLFFLFSVVLRSEIGKFIIVLPFSFSPSLHTHSLFFSPLRFNAGSFIKWNGISFSSELFTSFHFFISKFLFSFKEVFRLNCMFSIYIEHKVFDGL